MSLAQVYQYPIIIGIYLLRIEVVLQGHVWKDIQNGILPALNCFYCNPSNGPYGVLWWIISQGLRFNYAGVTTFIDFLVMVAIRNRYPVFPVYAFMSWLLWIQAPYDLPIIWITLLGLFKLPLVLLGPLTKLPVGAPVSVWHFVFSKPYNLNDLEYYGFMGIVFLAVILQVTVYGMARKNQGRKTNTVQPLLHLKDEGSPCK